MVAPALAILLSSWMVIETLIERPAASIAGLTTLVAGGGLYLISPHPDQSRKKNAG